MPLHNIHGDSSLGDQLLRLLHRRGTWAGVGEEEEEEEEKTQGCQRLGRGKVPGLGDH